MPGADRKDMSTGRRRAVPIRFLAALMTASKRAADQTTRIPGQGTPGYPDWPEVPPPPGGLPRQHHHEERPPWSRPLRVVALILLLMAAAYILLLLVSAS